MIEVQEINWNNFKAKFDGKEQGSFEILCYHLFCSEFNEDKGMIRFKNQTGIETEPIERDGEIIGWQAKFYEAKLSTKTNELKEGIKKAKNKNPSITKILFYVNREFSESSTPDKKDPEYKTKVEDYAKSLGVKIEWRVPSHFDRQLALEGNRALAQHYFSLGKSMVDFVSELEKHSESMLASIHSKITFNGSEIKIDRSAALNDLKVGLEKSALVIISGEGGTGKTALIKDLYKELKETAPFYVFKASEFNAPSINERFGHYGPFTFADFIEAHKDISNKYAVVDSAEKLSDIEDQAVFQEFLFRLLESGWRIIFTTRYGYLEDLQWQLVAIYNRGFLAVVNIENISKKELASVAAKYNIALPQNERFLDLIRIPFYLNEYLQNYKEGEELKTYSEFKNLIWNKKIVNSSYTKHNINVKRENCFFEIAKRRANATSFYVKADDLDNEALKALQADELIRYDSDNSGYFITHDTYEEWALDKSINQEFNKRKDCISFFTALGSSLPVRRAFRNWLSDWLLSDIDRVKSLIEESINNHHLENFWKDEVLVSVLLSNYAGFFFQMFEKKLLEDNEKLLMRVVFLLRIACKTIDEDMSRLLGLPNTGVLALEIVFTMPKGKGWETTIDFLYQHREVFGLRNMNIILPLLSDWNTKHKQGKTTRKTSLICLYYYERIFAEGGSRYSSRNEEDVLVKTILQGAQEIKPELASIFDEVIAKQEVGHREKYYDIVMMVLASSVMEGVEVISALPAHVIKLADLYWFQRRKDKYPFGGMSMGMEQYFGLSERRDFKYYPASALQTPIYQLLGSSFWDTIVFILTFTNKAVDCFVTSKLGGEAEQVKVFLDETTTIDQYICNRLWNTYRGTQVVPDLLESIHMALEKWLLQRIEMIPVDTLESICTYLLRNSKSASITAVVVSLVLAQPEKLFNIAKLLFQTKDFFLYDSARMLLDRTHKGQLEGLKTYFPSLGDFRRDMHENERIQACDDKHRKFSLEDIAFQYQLVGSKDDAEFTEFQKRKEAIWEIFDRYYTELPPEPEQTDADKTWRLFLARMDARKMKVRTEPSEESDKVLITFEPEIDANLKQHSEESLEEAGRLLKYGPLQMWSQCRFKRDKAQYERYDKYEKNPHVALSEAQEVIGALETNNDEKFSLFNRFIPPYVCTVVIRDFLDVLSEEEKEFCSKTIINFASIPLLVEEYSFQISDGVEPCISVLPLLIKCFPEKKEDIVATLCMLLLDRWPQISVCATRAVFNDLWEIDFEAAQSIFLGYLMLEPKYDKLVDEVRQEDLQKKIYSVSEPRFLKKFSNKYEKDMERVITGKIKYDDIGNVTQIELKTLNRGFELIPLDTKNTVHERFIGAILPVFAKQILADSRGDDNLDYELKHGFYHKFAYFILTSRKDKIAEYMKPFVENIVDSRDTADFIQEFVSMEDRLYRYEEFWEVWDILYEPIIDLCKQDRHYYVKEIVHNYLLAWPWWKKDAREWHTVKEKEKIFFAKAAKEVGSHPAVLYSLAKILNDIGSQFSEDGIFWISAILESTPSLSFQELEINTIFYMENLVKKYILTNRQKIRKSQKTRSAVVSILNFLIERGSVTGYLLREAIL